MIFKNKYELGFVEVTETHLGTVRLRAKAANGHETFGTRFVVKLTPGEAARLAGFLDPEWGDAA